MGYIHRNKIVHMAMPGRRVQELYRLYDGLWANYEADNAHELLLHGHITDLRNKLEDMAERDQEKYTFTMGATEALAFVQMWEGRAMPAHQAVIINSILERIDKKAKSPVYGK